MPCLLLRSAKFLLETLEVGLPEQKYVNKEILDSELATLLNGHSTGLFNSYLNFILIVINVK